MVWIWVTIGLLALAILQAWCKNKKTTLPPGPRGFPIFGRLHLLREFPNKDLHRLAQTYGDIMYMRLGLMPTIVVSSPKSAELFLKTHDLAFASRPPHEGAKHISFGQRSLSFAEYGPYWRDTRKMCTLELLSNQKINSFKSMRIEEVALCVEAIRAAANSGSIAVDLSDKVSSLSVGMSCRMVFGKKYMDFTVLKSRFRPSETMSRCSKVVWRSTLQDTTTYDPHKRTLTILGGLTTHIKFSDSSLFMRHPKAMNKVQKELENVVGLDRMVEESDLEKLEYLNMVLKETLRLHPVVPLLLPHAAIKDCTVNGYHIPKKSHVIINVWAIGRDPSAWTDAEEFIPERFEGSNIDVRGNHFELIPFGSGRRRCPGMHLGLTVVQIVLAQLVHCFDWELPDSMLPEELDMTEVFGLTISRAKHLLAIPSYRLHK
ncbi:cytochrome P450 CYP736A12-like [Prunus avium]|uniref:Cytochrome P450 CYP736A12-like n=1 Tax=Prunus avium TaxID=42229 RepID=A0A6P5TJN8_PRUAV|nr:cytochrome P450 CYP736A12-like [Prunus avium]